MRSAGSYSELEGWIDPISYGIIALIVAIYVWRVATSTA